MLWSLPMLALGLLALLRYGFGTLFVVGESVAMALLRSGGAGIAGTLTNIGAHPLNGALEAALGVVLASGAASLARERPVAAAALAAASAGWAVWFGWLLAAAVLAPGAGCALLGAGLRDLPPRRG